MTVILLGETSRTAFLTHHQPELKTQPALQKTELKLINLI